MALIASSMRRGPPSRLVVSSSRERALRAIQLGRKPRLDRY